MKFNGKNKTLHICTAILALTLMMGGCGAKKTEAPIDEITSVESLELETQLVEQMDPLTPAGPDYEAIQDLSIPETEPPWY